jgi:hypothetical protein
MTPETSRISPTGRYTAHVWIRNGLSPDALDSRLGRVLHAGLRPLNLAYERLARRPNLDSMLLARHIALDQLLARAVERDGVRQIVEIAAGFSGRGLRFARRYAARGLLYVEGDLPAVAAEKRSVLAAAGLARPDHQVVELNALAHPMWRRFATALDRFPLGMYVTDLHLKSELGALRSARAFRGALAVFARGRVYVHFADAAEVVREARGSGFAGARLYRPTELAPTRSLPAHRLGHVVRVLEARARGRGEGRPPARAGDASPSP